MACIFRQHKALGVVHVGNTACARVSRSTHKLNHFVQLFSQLQHCPPYTALCYSGGLFLFSKSPPKSNNPLAHMLLK